jgi:hypothetical protein
MIMKVTGASRAPTGEAATERTEVGPAAVVQADDLGVEQRTSPALRVG